MDVAVLGGIYYEFGISSVVYIHGSVIVLSLSYFYICSSSKLSCCYVYIYIGERHIQEYLKRGGVGSENLLSRSRRSQGMRGEIIKLG